MSLNDEPLFFFDNEACADFLKDKILPQLYKDLNIWNQDHKGAADVIINLGKTKEYKIKEYSIKYNGLYIRIDVGAQSFKKVSFPVVCGNLTYKKSIAHKNHLPLFTWTSYKEMLDRIKKLQKDPEAVKVGE